MDLDVGEVRFLTKVATKSPRGLKLVLFKEKATGNLKLVFIVKTAAEDIEKLALSKMTWQVEQNKLSKNVVICRLLILPDDSNEFFKSETGLILNESKDRKSLQSLANQKSIEIYFFNYQAEFHSRIELMTTYNMAQSVQQILEANPFVDDSRLIVKSENLSENDITNAMSGKAKEKGLKSNDLADSIQKKMPVASSKAPKTKPEEYSKTSIKTNEMASSGTFGTSQKPEIKNEQKSNSLSSDDLLRAVSVPPGKITPEELMKSIPPDKFTFSNNDVKEIDKSNNLGLNSEDLLKAISTPPGKITPEELMKSIPPEKFNSNTANFELTSDELMNSLNFSSNSNNDDKLSKENLQDIMNRSSSSSFVDDSPTIEIDLNPTQELQRDDLLNSLLSEPTPLKEEESRLVSDLMSEPTPLKSLDGNKTQIMKELEVTYKETIAPKNKPSIPKQVDNSNPSPKNDVMNTIPPAKDESKSISEDDLLKALKGEI